MTDPRAHSLLGCLLDGSPNRRVSVIGLSKNAGKTVTLNHLVQAAADQGISLGLVSTGRDGEEQDAITELPKPRIWAPPGALIATAAGALPAATARISLLRELPLKTPFGPTVLARVEAPGEVLLVGPGSSKRIAEALAALESLGAGLCLVDGSFDRVAAASPDVTGQVVLAVGAAYSSSMAETVTQVRFVLEVFDLPSAPPGLAEIAEQAAQQAPVSLVMAGGVTRPLPVPSALANPDPIVAAALEAQASQAQAYLVLNGALGDRLLSALLKHKARSVGLVVADPTRVLVERSLWRRWRRFGGQIYVRSPIRLTAVTTNPHSPVGQSYDPEAFYLSIREVANRPVFDLEAGLPRA